MILLIILFLCLWGFLNVTLFHMQMSGVMPLYGVLSPRYMISIFGNSLLAMYSVGVLLMVFDAQSRDERCQIQEALATKPVGDFQFFAGRLCGIFILFGVPLLVVIMIAFLYGQVSEFFQISFGEPIEPWSIASFLLTDVVPSFVVFGSLVLVLATIIKPRFIALLLSLLCLFGLFWINSRLPLHISSPLQTVTGSVIIPSELIPTFTTRNIIFNRVALTLIGIALLCWIPTFYPRNPSTKNRFRNGVCVFTAGLSLLVIALGTNTLEQNQIAHWKRVHDAHFDPASFPNIQQMNGTVDIYPGHQVLIALDLVVSINQNFDGEYILFSLNPGYRIRTFELNRTGIDDFKFRDGLLRVPRSHFASDRTEIKLIARGRPKANFAYLDAVSRKSKVFGPEVQQLRFLGTENYIFRPKFVVLMPGIKWYPTSGVATYEDSWDQRERDFFRINVQVSVPRNWIVAGPAKRELLSEEERYHYRFQTHNPLPKLALVAAPFEISAFSVEGVDVEVMYSKKHKRNFESLALTVDRFQELVKNELDKVSSVGLDYPYSVFSLVEVPASLRVFGGGIQMSSVLGMPGLLMMPETTLPTMHLDSLHGRLDFLHREKYNWTFATWMHRKVGPLLSYFGSDLFAGYSYAHLYRSLFLDQVSAHGPNAQLLNSMLEFSILNRFKFSGHSFDFDFAVDRDMMGFTELEPTYLFSLLSQDFEFERNDQLFEASRARARKSTEQHVWDILNGQPPRTLNLNELSVIERRTVAKRVEAASNLLADLVGPERLISIIADLLNTHRGDHFSYENFLNLVPSQQLNIDKLIRTVLHSTRLTGFIVSDLTEDLVESIGETKSVYQTSFVLHNSEPVSGICKVIPISNPYLIRSPDSANSEFFVFEGNQSLEITVQSKFPLLQIVIDPYLSLNRDLLLIEVNSLDDAAQESWDNPTEPEIVSAKALDPSSLYDSASIVIDDLDPGFSVIRAHNQFRIQPITYAFRRFLGKSNGELIGGLPEFQVNQNAVFIDTWERIAQPHAHGKYWKTLTLNRGGRGKALAQFAAQLPTSGSWKLEYFQPRARVSLSQVAGGIGSMNYDIVQSKGVATVHVHANSTIDTQTINTLDLTEGWHLIGEYQLDTTDVKVQFSNRNRWTTVFADAIRWTPVDKKSN